MVIKQTEAGQQRKLQISELYIHVAGQCDGLPPSWNGIILVTPATSSFPVETGAVVEVGCSVEGEQNVGASRVTCRAGQMFSWEEGELEPACATRKTGKIQSQVFCNFSDSYYVKLIRSWYTYSYNIFFTVHTYVLMQTLGQFAIENAQ